MRTRVKMCGTTRLEDALKAAEMGVDAIGLIFAKKSPRHISPEQAGLLAAQLPPLVSKVGVFVNESLVNIEEIGRYVGLNALQLHGQELPDFCAELKGRMSSCSLLKAIRVGEQTASSDFIKYADVVDGFVLDTYVKGQPGGTGQAFDWSLVKSLEIPLPFLLAGGLSPDNVSMALPTVEPFGIDINSGVESAPGIKDHALLADLIAQVRAFDLQRAPLGSQK